MPVSFCDARVDQCRLMTKRKKIKKFLKNAAADERECTSEEKVYLKYVFFKHFANFLYLLLHFELLYVFCQL